jgi:uncharacterized protein with ParB-like and HNH nuclease domain
MAYETPITIKNVIDNIRRRHYVLPSIQRGFVWDTEQIETLFDSLMRDYPISTFLFWAVDRNKIRDFQFYEFLRHYHEKDTPHNPKVELDGGEDVIAILDGQQRMTSLYIALTGSYAKKIPRYRASSPHAYPTKKLYLNLLKKAESVELEYDFRFLTEEEARPQRDVFWFECGKILELADMSTLITYLMQNGLLDRSVYGQQQTELALNVLTEFFNVIHQKGTISYFLEKSDELDKVLQIFIRINSGGTTLSYSDLLLSIATAKWQEKEAREVINEFVDEINKIGDAFSFNKDIVLKSCLVLTDLDVKFKVDNFTNENMSIIERAWDKIANALRATVELLAKYGYTKDSLIANNAIIPIAYFIYKNGFEDSIVHSGSRSQDRIAIKEWLARVLLKGVFGGQPDSIYPAMRELVNKHLGRFPLREIIEQYKGGRKSISFTSDDIDTVLELKYGQAKTYCALSLLYPGLNYSFKFHQDHIHPKSMFTKRNLRSLTLSDDEIDGYLSEFNNLPNLQLLQANQNIEKSDKPFETWLNQAFPSQAERESFLIQNHMSLNESLDLSDFPDFIQRRKKLIREKLRHLLDETVEDSSVPDA